MLHSENIFPSVILYTSADVSAGEINEPISQGLKVSGNTTGRPHASRRFRITRFKPDIELNILFSSAIALNASLSLSVHSVATMRNDGCNVRFSPGIRSCPVRMKRIRVDPAREEGEEGEERGIILWFHWCT